MLLEELEKIVIGKTLLETRDINFGSCYPLIDEIDFSDPDAKIIGVVCSEDGGSWVTDDTSAWYPATCEDCGKPKYYGTKSEDQRTICDCDEEQ